MMYISSGRSANNHPLTNADIVRCVYVFISPWCVFRTCSLVSKSWNSASENLHLIHSSELSMRENMLYFDHWEQSMPYWRMYGMAISASSIPPSRLRDVTGFVTTMGYRLSTHIPLLEANLYPGVTRLSIDDRHPPEDWTFEQRTFIKALMKQAKSIYLGGDISIPEDFDCSNIKHVEMTCTTPAVDLDKFPSLVGMTIDHRSSQCTNGKVKVMSVEIDFRMVCPWLSLDTLRGVEVLVIREGFPQFEFDPNGIGLDVIYKEGLSLCKNLRKVIFVMVGRNEDVPVGIVPENVQVEFDSGAIARRTYVWDYIQENMMRSL